MNYLGVDPGKYGAIALLAPTGELLRIEDMPLVDKQVSALLLVNILQSMQDERGPFAAAVEKVSSMPGEGHVGAFNFGRSYGIVLGAVAGFATRMENPAPGTWKKNQGVSSDKETSRKRALDLWPTWGTWFRFKKNADRAEAALIARHLLGIDKPVAAAVAEYRSPRKVRRISRS